jgi:DNA-directed RNA polymerase specialized sigma24 family protein
MIRSIGEATPHDRGIAHAHRVSIVAETEAPNAAIQVVRAGRVRRQMSLSPEIGSALRRFVARRVKNDDDAADIVQEAVLLACEELTTRRIDNPSRWLFTVARHLIVDHYRSQGRFSFTPLRSTVVDAEPALQTRPDLALSIAQCHEELGLLLHRIVHLTWLEHQVALLMSDVYGYGDKHSAAELRMSLPCFKLMLHGARLRLRQISRTPRCAKCAIPPLLGLRHLGVTCGLPEPQLFAVRGSLLEGLKR